MSRLNDLENLRQRIVELLPSKFEEAIEMNGRKILIISDFAIEISIEGVELSKVESHCGLRVETMEDWYKHKIANKIIKKINKFLPLIAFKVGSIYSNGKYTAKILSIAGFKDRKEIEAILPSTAADKLMPVFTMPVEVINGVETISPFKWSDGIITAEEIYQGEELIFNPYRHH